MEMKAFEEKLQQSISERLGQGYRITIQKVYKNNNIQLHSMVILSEKHNVSPNIYLDGFWKAYNNGVSMTEIVSSIIRIYREGAPKKNVDMEFFKAFEKVKDRICCRLICAGSNKELLETIPHVLFLDLAICFYYAYQGEELGNGAILIHNSHMEMWRTSVEELMRLALQNTPVLFPWTCNSLEEILAEYSEQAAEKCPQRNTGEDSFGLHMQILSNKQRIHGAACILYPGLLEKISGENNADLYILPSSIHEVILIADKGDKDPRILQKMVQEVNATQVEPEEVLSNKIYSYNSAEKCVKIIF